MEGSTPADSSLCNPNREMIVYRIEVPSLLSPFSLRFIRCRKADFEIKHWHKAASSQCVQPAEILVSYLVPNRSRVLPSVFFGDLRVLRLSITLTM